MLMLMMTCFDLIEAMFHAIFQAGADAAAPFMGVK